MDTEELRLKHTTQLRVRYADTDKMGIVYNGNYFTYFEVGRTELMRHIGFPYSSFEKLGYLLPLTETKAVYKQPAEYDDLLSIEATIIAAYKATVRFEYNIFRDDTTIALGYTVHSFINSQTRKPVRPPRELFDVIKEHLNKIKQ